MTRQLLIFPTAPESTAFWLSYSPQGDTWNPKVSFLEFLAVSLKKGQSVGYRRYPRIRTKKFLLFINGKIFTGVRLDAVNADFPQGVRGFY